jgi:hypothetical protein
MTKTKPNGEILSWESVVERKRALQVAKLAPYLDKGTSSSITSIEDVEKLTEMLGKGDLSAEKVILAYINRYVFTIPITNSPLRLTYLPY